MSTATYARTSQVNEIMDLGNEIGLGYAEYNRLLRELFDMELPPAHTETPIWHGLHNLLPDQAEELARELLDNGANWREAAYVVASD